MTENVPEPESRELIKVSKLHFLVHPGYTIEENKRLRSRLGTEAMKELMLNPKNYRDDFNERLLEMFIEQAQKMPEEELMLIFTPTDRSEFKDGIVNQDQYMTAVLEIKKILGKRAIVILDDYKLATRIPDLNKLGSYLINVIRARGFEINNDTESVAYGEYIGKCVNAVAINMRRLLKIQNPTTVIRRLTDDPISKFPAQLHEYDAGLEYD